MIHAIIVHDPSVFRLIVEQNETKKAPLANLPYEMQVCGNTRIIGGYSVPVEEVLVSVVHELNPDTVFFLSESYPVSDEKLSGDIVLPNVFFSHHSESSIIPLPNPPPKGEGVNVFSPLLWRRGVGGEAENGEFTEKWTVLGEEAHIPRPIFLEHYPIQGDYDFESFGLSVGGIHVSGEWNTESEDFRIRLRIVYENDTFDSLIYPFVEAAQKQGIQEKVYPVAYIWTEDKTAGARNLWSIVQFIIGSIDPESVSVEDEEERSDAEDEWSDGGEE